MPTHLPIACTVLAVCSAAQASGGDYSYLVTPAGHMYRMVGISPFLGAGGKHLGTAVSYDGETPDVARIEEDATEIMAALGPELQLAGETAAIVQVYVGRDRRGIFSTWAGYNVVFKRRGDQWVRSPRKPDSPDKVGGQDPSKPFEDPAFRFDRAWLAAGVDAAAKYVAVLDTGDFEASVAGMSEAQRSQVPGDRWRTVLEHRPVGKRVELYRLQTRKTTVPTPAGGAMVVYELRTAKGERFLESLTMVPEKEGWRAAEYIVGEIPRTAGTGPEIEGVTH